MNEQKLRRRIEEVRTGARSRRTFLSEMAALGLSAPFVTQMLAHSGVAMAATEAKYVPTKAGGGGTLKLLWWQAPTLLNPHFAVGTKDQDGSRLFYEPLAGWDADGNLVPILAAEIPSVEAGTVDNFRHVFFAAQAIVPADARARPRFDRQHVFRLVDARYSVTRGLCLRQGRDCRLHQHARPSGR
jgi:hypothetical protein